MEIVHSNRRTKYSYNHNYFDIIDTEEKAYILGFIIADGSIDKTIRKKCITNRLTFLNSIDDIEIIELIRNEISPESQLYFRNNSIGANNRKQQVCLRLNSFELGETLINKYNIIPRKTFHSDFKINWDNIPENLIRHFIRGYFDGDGSVSFYEVRNTIFFNFSFIFNSLEFGKQISEIFENNFKVKSIFYEKVGKTCTYYNMRFNYFRNRTNIIKEIYDYLYKDSKCFLNRKKLKFEEYFEYRGKSYQ